MIQNILKAEQKLFDYENAFNRNRGFISEKEQFTLKNARVAVAGVGGTGGAQILTLARMGIGHFTIADIDIFEMANFNRQMGATMSTIGHRKTKVLKEMILEINPEAEVTCIDYGITEGTVDLFLEGADIVVDSLDFYCFDQRLILYKAARERNLWVVTAPPLGFGCSMLVFDPQGMSFEEYFGFNANTPLAEKMASFMLGVCPSPIALKYMNKEFLKQKNTRLSCVSPAFGMVSGFTCTEVIRILLGKGTPKSAPWIVQFDALYHTHKLKYIWFGMKNPWMQIKKYFIAKLIKNKI